MPRLKAIAATGLVVFFGALILSSVNGGNNFSTSTNSPTSAVSAIKDTNQALSPKVEKKMISETEAIPFSASGVNDPSIYKGTSHTKIEGKDGIKSKTYEITLVDGKETSRTLLSETTTQEPVNKVIAVGTKVQLSCTNGTYVSTYGNEVCRPSSNLQAPDGATARCADGTYSYSQSRRGTCSRHGGVSTWL